MSGSPRQSGNQARALLLAAVVMCGAGSAIAAGSAVEGRVDDAESGEPIPFASIGIRNASTGTVADEDGRYRLQLAGDDGTVTFSAIGFDAKDVPVAALLANADVTLAPVVYALHESVSVEATASDDTGSEVVLGKVLEFRGHGVGFGSGQLGTEVGAHIRIDRTTLVQSANFVISHTRGDAFLYRVNVYDFRDGRVGANLLDRNVIVAGRTDKGTMTVDLSDHYLVVDHDVLLALEWVKDDDRREGVPPLMFRAKKRGRGNLYSKRSSQGTFEKLGSFRAGFYLVGYQAD